MQPTIELRTYMAAAHQHFAFRLLKEMLVHVDATHNFVVSSASIFMALQLCIEGASGMNQQDLQHRLGLNFPAEQDLRAASLDFKHAIECMSPAAQLVTANSVWVRPSFEISPLFKQICEEYYESDVLPLRDIGTVDAWIKHRTRGCITKSAAEYIYDVMVLNAVYFKAPWRQAFDKAQNRRLPFTRTYGTVSQADFMNRTGNFRGAFDPTYTLVELPYQHNRLSFVMIKPNGTTPLEFLSKLGAESFAQMYKQCTEYRMNLFVPKFEFRNKHDLNEPIKRLGFSSFFEENSPLDKILLSHIAQIARIVQQAFVQVNEEGTTAAAVTEVMGWGAPMTPQTPPPEVRFDSPFIFVIMETVMKVPLFIGVVSDPTQQ